MNSQSLKFLIKIFIKYMISITGTHYEQCSTIGEDNEMLKICKMYIKIKKVYITMFIMFQFFKIFQIR